VAAGQVRQILDCLFLLTDDGRIGTVHDRAPVPLPSPINSEGDHRTFVNALVHTVCTHPEAHSFVIRANGLATHYVYVVAALMTLYALHGRSVVLYLVDPAHRPTGISHAYPWIRFAEDRKRVSAHALVTHAQRLVDLSHR
jgi:hypothetical protein